MSTSRLRREAIGKRACDWLLRVAAGLAAAFAGAADGAHR